MSYELTFLVAAAEPISSLMESLVETIPEGSGTVTGTRGSEAHGWLSSEIECRAGGAVYIEVHGPSEETAGYIRDFAALPGAPDLGWANAQVLLTLLGEVDDSVLNALVHELLENRHSVPFDTVSGFALMDE